MAKALLEFNLPEDEKDFMLAVKAKELWLVLWEIDQELRSRIKYPSDSTSEEIIDALISIRDFLRESMSENNINFDM